MQALHVLHVWILHKRLITLGSHGLTLDEALYDELWDDTSNRIRGLGVGEMSVSAVGACEALHSGQRLTWCVLRLQINKHLKEVQSHSYRCCMELDEAVAHEPLEGEVLWRLAGVVWRHLYSRSEVVPDEHVLAVARYLRAEYTSVDALPAQAVLEGRLAFSPMPFPAVETAENAEELRWVRQHGESTCCTTAGKSI